jgi:hypothetical protein
MEYHGGDLIPPQTWPPRVAEVVAQMEEAAVAVEETVEASREEAPKEVMAEVEAAGAASFQEQSVSYVAKRGTTSSSASKGLIHLGPDRPRKVSPLQPRRTAWTRTGTWIQGPQTM